MKRILIPGLFATLLYANAAVAAPIALPENEPLFIQFVNIEQVDTSLTNSIDVPGPYGTAGNWGVLLVTTIQEGAVTVPNQDIQGGGSNLFVNGGVGGAQITGIFYDIDLKTGTEATGGRLDLYWTDSGSVDANCAAGTTCAPDLATVNLFTSGTLLASIEFASGINPLDGTTTIKSSLDVTSITGQGQADSFGNVDVSAGGAWADVLNGDWFNTAFGTRDIRFSNFFNLNPNWNDPLDSDVIGLRSNDPARVMTSAVPEPASLGLFGLALAGLAVQQRRRLRASRS